MHIFLQPIPASALAVSREITGMNSENKTTFDHCSFNTVSNYNRTHSAFYRCPAESCHYLDIDAINRNDNGAIKFNAREWQLLFGIKL